MIEPKPLSKGEMEAIERLMRPTLLDVGDYPITAEAYRRERCEAMESDNASFTTDSANPPDGHE